MKQPAEVGRWLAGMLFMGAAAVMQWQVVRMVLSLLDPESWVR